MIKITRIKTTTGMEITTENRTTIEKENAPQMMTWMMDIALTT